jgi:hypothetical protein
LYHLINLQDKADILDYDRVLFNLKEIFQLHARRNKDTKESYNTPAAQGHLSIVPGCLETMKVEPHPVDLMLSKPQRR